MGAIFVSVSRKRVPQSQSKPPTRIKPDTRRKAKFMFWPLASVMAPMTNGEITSPRAWMTRMFKAKALARIEGCVTLARMVFVGPVLKNKQKQAKKMKIHAQGNGIYSMAIENGNPMRIAAPEPTKYEPANRVRSFR